MPRTPRSGPSTSYRVRRVLADGTVREYIYVRKPPRRRGVPYTPDAVARIIDMWQRSPEWRGLADNSIKRYLYGLRWLDEYRHTPIGEIRRRDMLAVRDAIASSSGNGAANAFIGSVSALMAFAVERGHVEANPLARVRRLTMGSWDRWPEEAIEFAFANLPAPMVRAVKLGLYTGQRSGDCVRMCWSDFDGEGFTVRQQKTGTSLWVACHDDLKADLPGWPRTAVTILTDTRGRPWDVKTFQTRIYREINKHVELHGLQFHGLRKSAAARLAEAGCTDHEIAAITGHKSLSMVGLYTKDANQRTLARAAIAKLHRAKRESGG